MTEVEKRIDIKKNMLCSGCGHMIAMRLITEVLSEKNLCDKTIVCLDVACCSLLIEFVYYDTLMAAHGRVLPTSTGIKSVRDENVVLSYMGDGAAYSIGLNETMHSALRNEKIFAVVINNGLFAMTGGQCSPTTLIGQKTPTTIYGKDEKKFGKPFLIEDALSGFNIGFLARASLASKEDIDFAKKMLSESLDNYLEGKGFCMVELLSPCPTNLHLSPKDANDRIKNEVEKVFKVGKFKG